MKLEGKVFEAGLGGPSQGDEHIGSRLRQIRKLAGLTQAELAARLNIGQGALSRVESRKDILVSTLRDYLAALGATLRIDAQLGDAAALVTSMREAAFQFDPVDENQLLLPIIGDAIYPPRRDVVFSIKPEYCDAIIDGRKTVELRRRFPATAPVGTTVFIYATSPTRALVGMAEIGQVHCRTPQEIWDSFSDRACIARKDFDRYFDGVESGVAIELRRGRRLRRSLDLSELRERFSFEPPQSYLYATPKMREALHYECSEVSH
ncbi:MAG: helix-turn-helix domain-containing protein [Phenylobacterium sp.]|uniref:helix-turn-helix domain-containing protein n=1 Tax=Phenylobacterium sp. TaxID=1871053 RepID=UPI00273405CB|nr:helix-turn-helix domain-containing protein [Phenylobacterium sp.]MDP1643734.1 helix-turn-helix domain-containing protein [Phenylobacterium sp.]MDP3118430.1 helix-turn-helix domain-containing protein [Phenylobacterium sp.]